MRIIRHQDMTAEQRAAADRRLDAHERAMADDDDQGEEDPEATRWFVGVLVAVGAVYALIYAAWRAWA